jgi:hypothetical protein
MNAVGRQESSYTLLVPYNYGDAILDYNYEGKEITKEEYAKLVIESYNRYKDGITDTLNRKGIGRNLALNEITKENVKYKQNVYYFTETKVNLYDMNDREPSIDTLIRYYQTGEPFVLKINMYHLGDEKLSDLESDIKNWGRESRKIMNSPKFTDAEKIMGLSKKDLKIKFDDAKSCAILKNCKMFEYVNNRKFVFLVERIIFVTQ